MAKQQKKYYKAKGENKELLVKDIEKEYKMDFGVRGNMKLSTYLKKQGLPSLARALDRTYRIK